MRAITLWQPYATAIACGSKTIETRSWNTDYRGRIAIHAAKRWTPKQRRFAQIEVNLGRLPPQIHLGMVVATAEIVDVRTSEELLPTIDGANRTFGDFAPGRFGWMLENIQPLREPFPWVGRQRFFTIPDELIEKAI